MSSSINNFKNALLRVINYLGINIYRTKGVTLANLTYEPIKPPASYAPWNMDLLFQDIYKIVKDYTFVDKYRCYELWTLVEQSQKLSNGALIEIGVWRGGSGSIIAKKATYVGITDPVYLCDTFKGVVKAGSEDISFYKGGEHADTSLELVETLVHDTLGLNNVIVLEGIFPEDTARLITSTQFRFCHIDVDTYNSARDIVDWIWGKMVLGGIIVFDDYGFKYCEGVTNYVEELRGLTDRMLIHNLNGHAIMMKIRD